LKNKTKKKPSIPAPANVAPEADLEVAIAQALDQELDWYFSYAESAKRFGNVAFLPTHESQRLAEVDDSDDAIARRALQLTTTIQSSLNAIADSDAGVLRAVFTPRRWPNAVTREFAHLSAIAVRLTCAANPWPSRNNHDGLETAAGHYLAHLLAEDRAQPARLKKAAGALMGKAVTAYAYARAKGANLDANA
jgi:hypothetical protein